jgi:catechol 2,3-dioxygenase-like lactoylglutathione lyase family enzyme
MSEPLHDLAHIGHAELLTPFAQDSLDFFVELFGMEVEAREGQSVSLRGWGDYQRYSLKLTESDLPGLGHMAIRAWSPEALGRRVDAIERTGLGIGWIEGDHGHGPAYRFTDPDGHAFEIYYETERYDPPDHLRPALKNVPQRYVGRGAAVKRLDHVNLLGREDRRDVPHVRHARCQRRGDRAADPADEQDPGARRRPRVLIALNPPQAVVGLGRAADAHGVHARDRDRTGR